jgi:hypothetical protein
VFQGRVLYEYITSTGIAGKAFLDRLRLLVERYGRGSHAGTRSGSDEVEGKDSRHARGGNEKKISMELLEEIRSRGCFIHPEPVQPLVLPPDTATSSSSDPRPTSNSKDNLAETLRQAYLHTSDPNTRPTVFVDETSVHGSQATAGRSHSSTRWVVPGWVRERTGEVFFELGEGDEGCSLQEVLAGCLVKVSSPSLVLVIVIIVVRVGDRDRDRDHFLRVRRG